jgi:hypothetical protein
MKALLAPSAFMLSTFSWVETQLCLSSRSTLKAPTSSRALSSSLRTYIMPFIQDPTQLQALCRLQPKWILWILKTFILVMVKILILDSETETRISLFTEK